MPPPQNLPALVDRTSQALAGARSAAEVLEARDMAGVAHDAAKRAGRLAQAKGAHDELIGAAYRAQADAAIIEAAAKAGLADEYDAAQERGEVAGPGRPEKVEGVDLLPTAAELGLSKQQVHEVRQIRNPEQRGGVSSL